MKSDRRAAAPRSQTPSPLGRFADVMRRGEEATMSSAEQRGMARRLFRDYGVIVLWPGDGNAFQQAAISILARQLYGERNET